MSDSGTGWISPIMGGMYSSCLTQAGYSRLLMNQFCIYHYEMCSPSWCRSFSNMRNSICSEFQIQITSNLGTYLDVPLTHKIVSISGGKGKSCPRLSVQSSLNQPCKSTSFTVERILKAFQAGARRGDTTCFWTDSQLLDEPLINVAIHTILRTQLHCTIKSEQLEN